MLTNRPRGTNDILPGETEKWQWLENEIRRLCREYGYREIRTPVFEHTILFRRGVGEDTDVVEKEMYTFFDRGETSLTLRPEGTAAVVRAYIENGLYNQPQPVKLYYVGPMFRYDRPQAGRYRQFHQFGVEVIGTRDPCLDVELLAMASDFCQRLGLWGVDLQINSVGCPSCRPLYREELRRFLADRKEGLCDNCRRRAERNPLRVLDCKETACQEKIKDAPVPLKFLCPACAEHFAAVEEGLKTVGVAYSINPRLVRGLDYYTLTAFELVFKGIGAQNSIGGGGRYDGLVEECGGPAAPGAGFAFGLERLLLALAEAGADLPLDGGIEVFVAVLGREARLAALKILQMLRAQGLSADMDYLGRSLKAQMKVAGKSGAPFALLVGGEELARGAVVVRDMRESSQAEVPVEEAADYLKKVVGKAKSQDRRSGKADYGARP